MKLVSKTDTRPYLDSTRLHRDIINCLHECTDIKRQDLPVFFPEGVEADFMRSLTGVRLPMPSIFGVCAGGFHNRCQIHPPAKT